jgi:hypothetical protein
MVNLALAGNFIAIAWAGRRILYDAVGMCLLRGGNSPIGKPG